MAEKTQIKQMEAQTQMQKVVNAMQKRYDKGLVTFSELLTMRQNLIAAQKAVKEEKGEQIQQLIAFHKAVGI